MSRARRSLVAAATVAGLAAPAATASASPLVAVVAGPVVGEETGIGGALGARLGLRTASGPARWSGFAEVAALGFLGFGPHSGMSGYHALLAGEWSRGGPRRRGHVFTGVALDHWRRPGTEHDQDIDTTALDAALGAGASWGPVRVDVEATFTLYELSRATDSPVIGPQLMLVVSAGRP